MSAPEERIGVVLVDDDAVARRSLRELIDGQAGMRVVGEASDGAGALELAVAPAVDVMVVEAMLPGAGTAGLLEGLRRGGSHAGVVVLTRSERETDVLRLVQAGAAAYLRKAGSTDDVVAAVRLVAAGGHVLEPQALQVVLQDYCARCRHTCDVKVSALTLREREVLTLVAEGRSTKEIAAELCLSHKTVEVHRRRIMHKLELHKVADLVRYAVREGLVGLNSA